MFTTLRTAPIEARACRDTRHLAGISFCDSCTQVADTISRAAERRQQARSTVLTPAR